MEYRCRLGTATGEILEEIHVSDSEAHLRRELEQKGFCVLGLRPKGLLGQVSLPGRVRRRVPMRDFLVFNQELATLLKAGMPLVQSLDILRSRVEHPTFRPVLDEVYDKVRAGSSLSDAFGAHGDLFPASYGASLLAGEKSGSLDGVLRRYVAYMKVVGGVKRRTLAALVYPAVLIMVALVVVAIPEEMAVVEALQFHRLATEEIGMEPVAVVLNGCHERRFSDADEAEVLRLTAEEAQGDLAPGVPLPAALRAARRQIRRRKLTRFYQARLRRSLDAPLVSLPFLFRDTLSLEDVRLLAGTLEAA